MIYYLYKEGDSFCLTQKPLTDNPFMLVPYIPVGLVRINHICEWMYVSEKNLKDYIKGIK